MGKRIEKNLVDTKAESNGKKAQAPTKSVAKTEKASKNTKVVKEQPKVVDTKVKRVVDKTQKNKKKKDKKGEEVEGEETNFQVFTDVEESQILGDIAENYTKSSSEVESKLKLDKSLITKAVSCLKELISKKHKESMNLLASEEDEFLYLNFVLGKLPVKYSVRPSTIPLPNSIYGEKLNTRVCVFVKDPRSDFKDLKIDFPFKVKVLDVQKLKLKYSRFQERRDLLKEYEIFLCDYKIYFLLKKLLGKPFYASRKYPIPINIDYTDKEDIKKQVVNHIEKSTHFYMTNGPNYSVKVARSVASESDIINNVTASAKGTLPHILKWGLDFDA